MPEVPVSSLAHPVGDPYRVRMGQKSAFLQLLQVRTTAVAAEALEALLEEKGALGSAVEQRRGARFVRLQAYFVPDVDVPVDWVREKLGELHAYGVSVGPAEVRLRRLRDEDWTEFWKKRLRPIRISKRLTVIPMWETPFQGKGDVIRIDPGMVFGLGDHPTTRGCLQMLERMDPMVPAGGGSTAGGSRPVASVAFPTADVGSGTGILAIRAVQLGLGPAEAFETEEEAVRCGRASAERNAVAEQIAFRDRTMPARGSGPYERILANIFLTVLVTLLPRFARSLVSGGELLAAGITGDQEDRLREEAEQRGLRVVDRICERTQRGARRWPVLRFRLEE